MKDIQAPVEPAWWLIAPAWQWLAVVLVFLSGCAWLLQQRRRNEQLARVAARELDEIVIDYRHHRDTRWLALHVSRWLKQVAMLAFPERQLQRLHGDAWLEFLDLDLADRPFSRGCGRVFAVQLYRREVQLDADEIIRLCERWLLRVRPRLRARGGS